MHYKRARAEGVGRGRIKEIVFQQNDSRKMNEKAKETDREEKEPI
jgi:hypothetical protein